MINVSNAVAAFVDRGVDLVDPASTFIGSDVPPDAISAGVRIFPGCRIQGAATRIGPDSELGREGPATLQDCQLGSRVSIAGGFCTEATFLDDVSVGADAHIRYGTLLEEQVTTGHAVGLKQTLLMPFVTTGSLINFCDVLMAGGTSRKDHSEIGSSYVHFNFTPNQDKATASLVGDVPRGVMLDQPPIFLGGQGGLVGPARVAYGTVLAAGAIQRGDLLTENRLVFGRRKEGDFPRAPGMYLNGRRLLANNVLTIASLHALRQWYRHARARFLQATPAGAACHAGAIARIESTLRDRVHRLGEVAERFGHAHGGEDARPDVERRFQKAVAERWPELREQLTTGAPADAGADFRAQFLAVLPACPATGSYIATIRALAPASRRSGTRWLQAIVDAIVALAPKGT